MRKSEFMDRWGKMTLSQLGDYISNFERICEKQEELYQSKLEAMRDYMRGRAATPGMDHWQNFLRHCPEAKYWFDDEGHAK